MPGPSQEFLESIAPVLGWYYAAAAALNAAASWRSGRGRHRLTPFLWLAYAVGFAAGAVAAFCGHPPAMPGALKAILDAVLGPITLWLGAMAALTVLFVGRRFFVIPAVAWTACNAAILFLGASLADAQFAAAVLKPDNVPIVAMVFLLGFFVWLGAAQAIHNDRRLAHGESPAESQFAKPVLVWPDLVYIELICMVLLSVALVVWSLGLPAPLEQPANPAVTPNPSKGALVFPWFPGDAGLLRPGHGGSDSAGPDHRGAGSHPLSRSQPKGERLLHDRPTAVQLRGVHVRLSSVVDSPDPRRDFPAGTELEFLRALRASRSAPAIGPSQRQALRVLLGDVAEPRRAANTRGKRRASSAWVASFGGSWPASWWFCFTSSCCRGLWAAGS